MHQNSVKEKWSPVQNEMADGPPFGPTLTEDLDPFKRARSTGFIRIVRWATSPKHHKPMRRAVLDSHGGWYNYRG